MAVVALGLVIVCSSLLLTFIQGISKNWPLNIRRALLTHTPTLIFALVCCCCSFRDFLRPQISIWSYWSYTYIYIFVVSTETIFKYLLPALLQYILSKESLAEFLIKQMTHTMCFTILEEPLNSTENEDFSRMLTQSTFNLYTLEFLIKFIKSNLIKWVKPWSHSICCVITPAIHVHLVYSCI